MMKFLIFLFFIGGNMIFADTLLFDRNGRLPLHNFCFLGDISNTINLIKPGTDINIRAKNGMTPLHYAVLGNHPAIVRLLMDRGTDPSIRDNAGMAMQPLYYACLTGSMEIVRLLIGQYHLDVNSTDANGTTLLMTAVRRSNLELARYLAEKGADLNRRDCQPQGSFKLTALDNAYYTLTVSSNKNSMEMIRYLRSIGAKTSYELDHKKH